MRLGYLIETDFSSCATATKATGATGSLKTSEDVAIVADVAVAQIENEKSTKWKVFINHCLRLSVTELEVETLFSADDKDDLTMEPLDVLPLHAKTIASQIVRNRIMRNRFYHDPSSFNQY